MTVESQISTINIAHIPRPSRSLGVLESRSSRRPPPASIQYTYPTYPYLFTLPNDLSFFLFCPAASSSFPIPFHFSHFSFHCHTIHHSTLTVIARGRIFLSVFGSCLPGNAKRSGLISAHIDLFIIRPTNISSSHLISSSRGRAFGTRDNDKSRSCI